MEILVADVELLLILFVGELDPLLVTTSVSIVSIFLEEDEYDSIFVTVCCWL